MMSNPESWKISSDDRIKHDAQFAFLRPVNGFVTGEQAKPVFLKSGLSQEILCKIWQLADYNSDGKMSKQEFSIGLFLVQKALQGFPLPDNLPPNLLKNPDDDFGEHIFDSSSIMNTHENDQNWVIPPAKMPKYKLQFNEHDRARKNYLTGLEARAIMVKTGLPQSVLAHIWNLSDLNNDGCLSSNEFCIASFLIEQALSGRKLPQVLPPSMLQFQNSPTNKIQSFVGSFEEKRMENFQNGQAELERRQREFREQQEREEEEKRLKQKAEQERMEKAQQEAERIRLAEEAKKLEIQRQALLEIDKKRREAHDARVEAYKKLMYEKALENENSYVEKLKIQHAQILNSIQFAQDQRASLLKTATEQLHRLKELDDFHTKIQVEHNDFRDLFGQMRLKRNQYEEDIRGLSEKLTTVIAERSAIQREMTRIKESNPMGLVNNSHLVEQKKTLLNDLQLKKANIEFLQSSSKNFTSELTNIGTELANRRNKAKELETKARELYEACQNTKSNLMSQCPKNISEKSVVNPEFTQSNGDSLFNWTEIKPQSNQSEASDLFAVSFPNNSANNQMTSNAFELDPFSDSTLKSTSDKPKHENPKEEIYYRAIYDFDAIRSDEISFRIGDRIRLVNKEPGNGWLTGELISTGFPQSTTTGFFPETYAAREDKNEVLPFSSITGTSPISFGPAVVSGKSDKKMIDPFDPFAMHSTARAPPLSSNPTNIDNLNDPFAQFNSDPFSPIPNSRDQPILAITNGFDAFSPFETNANPLFDSGTMVFECKALFPYESSVNGDLSFSPDEIICVTKVQNQDWYTGYIKNQPSRQGMFPMNYVQKISVDSTSEGKDEEFFDTFQSIPTASSIPFKMENSQDTFSEKDIPENEITVIPSNRPEIATVIAEYTAKESNQLSLKPGQFVQIKRRSAKGWWEGEIQQRGQQRRIGWFPADYVRINSPVVKKADDVINKPLALLPKTDIGVSEERRSSLSSGKTAPARPPPPAESSSNYSSPASEPLGSSKSLNKDGLFKALYSYKANYEDELTFEEGEIIQVLSKEEPEWWRGRIESNGREGLFPVNYVKPIVAVKSKSSIKESPSSVKLKSESVNSLNTDDTGLARN